MILEELVLNNVGPFFGRNAVSLRPPSPEQPIILIGALNGTGKTTLLEAIELALYGPLANISRRDGTYEKYLRGLIHHGVPDTEGAFVELVFTAHQEGREMTFRVRRQWRSTGQSIREILLIYVDGRYEQVLSSAWSEYVETFLPRGIAGLFFFDGEQIEALADMERSQDVLKAALSALLGLDLVDRLDNDLAVLKRRHNVAAVPDSLKATLEEKQHLVAAQRQAEEVAAARVSKGKIDVARCNEKLHAADEAYRGAGGSLVEQRDQAESRVRTVKEAVGASEDAVRVELAGVAPLLQIEPLLARLASQAEVEQAASKARLLNEELQTRDAALLEMLKNASASTKAIDVATQFLADDRAERIADSQAPEVAQLGTMHSIDALMTGLPAARVRLIEVMQRRARLKVELDQAERLVAATPDPIALLPLRQSLDAAEEDSRHSQAMLQASASILEAARASRIKAQEELDSLLEKSAKAEFAASDDLRVQKHIGRVRATLWRLRSTAASRHLGQIAQFVLDALGTLLRKDNLITDLAIDPETYAVSLTGLDNRPLEANALSAGERQLLAVALLWGLARASGQPLPVVIDTPLGRLDKSHRANLLEKYFPKASHQVVLLSTDTEIDQDAYARIAPYVGHAYRLDFDSATGSTEIVKGYFWRKP
jgi:DNA sulfur modification protein DndD